MMKKYQTCSMPLWEVVNRICDGTLKLDERYIKDQLDERHLKDTMKYCEDAITALNVICNGFCINPIHINTDNYGHEANVLVNNSAAYVLYLTFNLGNYAFYDFETKKITINCPNRKYNAKAHAYDLKTIYNTFKCNAMLNELGPDYPYINEIRALNGLLQSYETLIIAYDNLTEDEESKLQQYYL